MKKELLAVVVLLISMSAVYGIYRDPKPILYGTAFDGLTPADGAIVTIYPDANHSDTRTDVVGVTGNTGLSGYWKLNLFNLKRDVQNGDVIIVHISEGIKEITTQYVVNLNDGTYRIDFNLDPAYQDFDGDGFMGNVDCNDHNTLINPGATEKCDGVDNDCDGLIDEEGAVGCTNYYYDIDSDGFGNPNQPQCLCAAEPGFVTDNTDCNDTDPSIYPGASEICDGKDNNCDGIIDGEACMCVNGETKSCGTDIGACVSGIQTCVDGNWGVCAGAVQPSTEICDGIDNNCDGVIDESNATDATTYYRDADGDGFGNPLDSVKACSQPQGYVTDATDCDDTNPQIHPQVEELCDGKDNNCNGQVDENICYQWSIKIFPGWNSIALIYHPANIETSEELGQAIMNQGNINCTVIMRLDAKNQVMIDDILGLGDPPFGLAGGEGYFIHCNGETTFTYEGGLWLT